MWKLHTAIVLIAGAVVILGLSGSQLIAGSILDRMLGDLDIWLQGGLSYPTLGAFGLGVLAAYAVYGLWLLSRYYDLTRWLVRLSDLWAEGVSMRADGLALATDSQVTAWVERRYTGWHNRVVECLEPIAPVDARFFATTPETPPQDAGTAFRSAFHRLHVQALGQELEKLKTVIDRHQARLSPVIVALIMRLQAVQAGTFGHVPRAREFERNEPAP